MSQLLSMKTLRLAALLVSSSTIARAFLVDFNSKDHCVGSTIGTFNGFVGSGCQTKINNSTDSIDLINVPGGAFNVITHPDFVSKGDAGKAVAFYSNPDCTLLIGLSNVASCVGAGSYASYEVIDLADAWAGEYNLQPPRIIDLWPNATVTYRSGLILTEPTAYSIGLTAHSSTPSASISTSSSVSSTSDSSSSSSSAKLSSSIAPTTTTPSPLSTSSSSALSTTTDGHLMGRRPSRKERLHQIFARNTRGGINHIVTGDRIHHGAVRRTNNGMFRFHQIADRAWRGVRLEDWDENVHKRNVAPLVIESPKNQLTSFLRERYIPASSCNMVRSCMVDSGEDHGFTIKDIGVQLLDTIKALDPSGNHWSFLQPGLIIEMVDEHCGCIGFVYAQTDLHNEKVQTCSSEGTQADTLQAALAMGDDGTSATDMRIDVKLLAGSGVTDSLFVSTRSADNADIRIHPICESVEVNY